MATRTKRRKSQQAPEPQPQPLGSCLCTGTAASPLGAGERQQDGTKLGGRAWAAERQSPACEQKAPEM